MRPIINFSFVALIAFASLSFTFCGHNTRRDQHRPKNGFAVVELFTSEGCSSCPAADEVVRKLSAEFNDHVYFLGYHVDYWDYIGWKDKFSQSAFSDRQRNNASVFGLNSIYTPQIVINGKNEMVGSREGQVRTTIKEQLENSDGVAIQLQARDAGNGLVNVTHEISSMTGMNLCIALVQLHALTSVKRGENHGRTLEHVNVVRELKMVSAVKGSTEFKIPSGLTANDIKIIAFLQDKNSMEIKAGAAVTVTK